MTIFNQRFPKLFGPLNLIFRPISFKRLLEPNSDRQGTQAQQIVFSAENIFSPLEPFNIENIQMLGGK